MFPAIKRLENLLFPCTEIIDKLVERQRQECSEVICLFQEKSEGIKDLVNAATRYQKQ